jgi:hypothetical protein
MPAPDEILSGLYEIANNWQMLAIFWHVYFAVLALFLISGIRPEKRLVGFLLCLPLLSVSALALASGNPFNGIFFILCAAALLFISFRLPREKIRIAPAWVTMTGAIMFAFGWVYPHFLESASFYPYLYSAPAGLVPCPTLSIVIGLSIIVGSLGVRAWSIVLGLSGAFYGVFGAVHLGVSLDWILLLGVLAVIFTFRKDTKRDPHHAAT